MIEKGLNGEWWFVLGIDNLYRVDRMRWTRWAAGAFGLFAVYQLLTFVPQPLDGPDTLRPVLLGWYLSFLSMHPGPAEAIVSWRILLIATVATMYALALAHAFGKTGRLVRSRAVFFSAGAVALFVCRCRSFLEDELNDDEGQFITAAHKLFFDPIYFRSVDVGTSGPVNIVPLMAPAVFGFSPDYASARLVAFALVLVSLVFLYRTFSYLTDDEGTARLATAALIGWFAVLENGEFVHYSSEQVPLCLTSIAVYLCARLCRDPKEFFRSVVWLGLVCGAAFFAKMQVLPIVAALAAVGILRVVLAGPRAEPAPLAAVLRRLVRTAGGFAAGLLVLPLAALAVCVATGTLNESLFAYVFANLSYQGSSAGASMADFVGWLLVAGDARLIFMSFVTVAAAFAYLRVRPWRTGEPLTLVELAVVCTLAAQTVLYLHDSHPRFQFDTVGQAAPWVVRHRFRLMLALASPAALMLIGMIGRQASIAVRWFGAASLITLAAAVFAVYAAHRLFPHYQTLLFVPIGAAIGAMIAQRPRAFAVAVVGVALFGQTQLLWGRSVNEFANVPVTVRPPEGDPIRRIGTPSSPITVWGWTVRPYLGSGRPPATRDSNMANFFRNIPEVDTFYRERFLRDLKRSRPEVFVDAIGPESLALQDRAVYGFEQIKPIAEYVKANYVLVEEIGGERIYARRDVAERAGTGSR